MSLLDFMELIEAGKIKPSVKMKGVLGEKVYFTREDISAASSRRIPEGSPRKPVKPIKAWSPKADANEHYSPTELSRAWGLSVHTIRRQFENEPGVMKIGDANPNKKRRYVTMRIPQGEALRVHRKLCS